MARRQAWQQPDDEERTPPAGAARAVAARSAADDRRMLAVRLRFLVLLFVLFGLVVIAQLIFSQVVGMAMRSKRPEAPAVDDSRGRIIDANGLLLAMDDFAWEIYASPSHYRSTKTDPARLPGYAAILGVPAEALSKAVQGSGVAAVVAKNVSAEQCQTADDDPDLPEWIWCDGKRQRIYLHGSLAAHVLGFVDRDQVGRMGVEAYYNDWLRTSNTWPANRLPGAARPLPDAWSTYLPSPGGRDLVLHLDAGLQYMVEKRLAEALVKYKAKDGVIIVMRPQTGAILALANWPTYDPNRYMDFTDGEWANSAISQIYEPGSIFKPITYAAGLDTGKLSAEELFEDTGSLVIDNKKIENAEKRAYGIVTARQALASSINVVTANICLRMGSETFYRYLRQFRFGQYTEIDAGPEEPGIVKWVGTRYWSRLDQATNSFGQGLSTTPLQMIDAIAAIANGGTVMQPQLVQSLVSNGKVYDIPPRTLGRAIKPETARELTEMMVFTVESYMAGPNLVPGFRVAGKTGTAQVPEAGGYSDELTITSFVGFFPAADPQLIVLVKLSEPQTSRWAEQVAMPVFGQVAQDAVDVLKLQPDDRMP
ncbi:MAG: Stage V sporulation protein D [Chloroflexi bacterium ADurb.Bin325]|nr:MAG: Stage V sporulation protein D [Chloroflexi bacterium ADurb.Bin325]